MNSTFFKIVGICVLMLNSAHCIKTLKVGEQCHIGMSSRDTHCICPKDKYGSNAECKDKQFCNAYRVAGFSHGSGQYQAKCEDSSNKDSEKVYKESKTERNLLSSKVKKDD